MTRKENKEDDSVFVENGSLKATKKGNQATLYSGFRFLKPHDISNQKSFPLDLLHFNFLPISQTSIFLKPIFTSILNTQFLEAF